MIKQFTTSKIRRLNLCLQILQNILVHEKTRLIFYQCPKCSYKVNNNHQHFLNHIDHQHSDLLEVNRTNNFSKKKTTFFFRIKYKCPCQIYFLLIKVFLFLWTFHSDNTFLYYLSLSFIILLFFCLENICMNISVSLLFFSRCSVALLYSIRFVIVCFVFFCFLFFFLLKISIIKFIWKFY